MSAINARWPLPRTPRIRPALPLPWFPPTTAAGSVLMRHPRLFSALFPLYLASYPALSLKPRERELVILRASWNAGGYYEWGHHANVQRALGKDWAWMRRIARGPDALGWEPRQVALLRAVDELYSGQRIGDDTWNRLYFLSPRQRTELCLITGFYDAGAQLYGSLGIPFDGWSRAPLTLPSPPAWSAPLPESRGPREAPAPIPAGAPERPTVPWLPVAPQARKLLAGHPHLPSALRFLAHRVGGRLALTGDRIDLVVLRTLAHCGLDAAWAQEEWRLRALAAAPGLPARARTGTAAGGREAALLEAVDELHTGRYVTDATWTELAGFLTHRQLIELLTAVGAFRMLAMTANTLDGRV